NSASQHPVSTTSRVTQPTTSRRAYGSQPALYSPPRAFNESGQRIDVHRDVVGMPYELAPAELHVRVRVVAEVQHQLRSRGYYRGWIDGRYGGGTAFAVRTFQYRLGISPTGELDMRTLDALGLPAENVSYLESMARP